MSDVSTAHTKIWKELSLFLIKSPFAFSIPSNTSNSSNIECRHELSESYSYTQAHDVDTYAHYCNSCCLALLLFTCYFLRSRHGKSAYIIEQGWNLVVNRPHFRSYLIGQGSFDWVTLNSACRLGYESSLEPSCQSLFGLWLSPWIYTRSYSEISADRSQAFWKRLYLCYSDSHVENPHFPMRK